MGLMLPVRHISPNFGTLPKKWFLRVYIGFGKSFWTKFDNKIYSIGLILIVANGQNWKQNLAIWSHWILPRWKFFRICCKIELSFKNWPSPNRFLLIFVLFKQQIYKKSKLKLDSNWECRRRRQARWPLDLYYGPRWILLSSLQSTILGSNNLGQFSKSQSHKNISE